MIHSIQSRLTRGAACGLLLFAATLVCRGDLVLENYEIASGADPQGGFSVFYAPGNATLFSQANVQVDYAEVAHAGGEALRVSPKSTATTRFLNVLRYTVSPATARSAAGDGLLNAILQQPVIRFDAERIAGAGTSADFSVVRLVLETDASNAVNGEVDLCSMDVRDNTSGPRTLSVDLSTHAGFQKALAELLAPGSVVTKFKVTLRQHTANTVPMAETSTWLYDNFALGRWSSYGGFRLASFSAKQRVDPRVGGDRADPDGDGLFNLQEFLLGTDPQVADSPAAMGLDMKLSPLTGDPTKLEFSYSRHGGAPDLSVGVESSSDLLAWDQAAPLESLAEDDGNRRLHRLRFAAPPDRVFQRLRLEAPPVSQGYTAAIPGDWNLAAQPMPPLADIIAKPAGNLPVYGLYCWAQEYLTHRDFIRELGWRHFRLSGPVNDAVMRAYAEDGATVMFTMAARRPFATAQFPNGEWRNRGNYASDEEFIAAYLADVSAVIARYGPDGTFWSENPDLARRPMQAIEIFNEPNFWYLNLASEDMDTPAAKAERIVTYSKLLPAAYAHIKSLAPSLTVVGFGTGGSAAADVPFITDVHAANSSVAASYDVLSTHPYVLPVPTEANNVRPWGQYSMAGGANSIRTILASLGNSDKPLWWTELNWAVTGGTYPDNENMVPERLQAAYLVRAHARALRLGAERLTIMSLKDTDGTNSGLLNPGGGRRASAHAMAAMMAVMPHPKLLGAPVDGSGGIHVYQIEPDSANPGKPPVTMCWSVEKQAQPLVLTWPHASAWLTDMEGRVLQQPAIVNGLITVPIGPEPVYVFPDPG